MKLFAVSDVHSFYSILVQTLQENGFCMENQEHVLLLLGDAFDRGEEPLEMADFLLTLHKKGRLIYVKGNHEDLLIKMLQQLANGADAVDVASGYHAINGTWQTALKLSGMSEAMALHYPFALVERVMRTRVYRDLLPSCVDYYELDDHVFVHGWIPVFEVNSIRSAYCSFDAEWRDAESERWERARWKNGMEMACVKGMLEPGKTIVCGHYHTSWGHAHMHGNGSEWGQDADFSVFKAPGIVAMDACTARSHKINCIVYECSDPMIKKAGE